MPVRLAVVTGVAGGLGAVRGAAATECDAGFSFAEREGTTLVRLRDVFSVRPFAADFCCATAAFVVAAFFATCAGVRLPLVAGSRSSEGETVSWFCGDEGAVVDRAAG